MNHNHNNKPSVNKPIVYKPYTLYKYDSDDVKEFIFNLSKINSGSNGTIYNVKEDDTILYKEFKKLKKSSKPEDYKYIIELLELTQLKTQFNNLFCNTTNKTQCKLGYFMKKLSSFKEVHGKYHDEFKIPIPTFKEFMSPLIKTLQTLINKDYYSFDIKPDNIAFEYDDEKKNYIPRFIDLDGWWEDKDLTVLNEFLTTQSRSFTASFLTSSISNQKCHDIDDITKCAKECYKNIMINCMIYQIILCFIILINNNLNMKYPEFIVNSIKNPGVTINSSSPMTFIWLYMSYNKFKERETDIIDGLKKKLIVYSKNYSNITREEIDLILSIIKFNLFCHTKDNNINYLNKLIELFKRTTLERKSRTKTTSPQRKSAPQRRISGSQRRISGSQRRISGSQRRKSGSQRRKSGSQRIKSAP